MTAIPQPSRLSPPPASIVNPLKQVARRHWSVVAARGVLLTLLVSLGVLLAAVVALSFLPYLPQWARITAAVLVWGSVLAASIYFLRPAMRPRGLVRTAMDVERALAAGRLDTHERISSSLELSGEADPRFAGSPALVQHLMRQAETDAAAIVPERIVSTKAVSRLALLLIPMLAAWVLLAFYLPPSRFLRPLFNLLMPWQETPAFLSDLHVHPGNITLGQGERLEISARVSPQEQADRNRKIGRAAIETRDLASSQVKTTSLGRVGPRDFKFVQEAAQKSLAYRVVTDGGDSAWYTATVEPVPGVETITVRYDHPAYTGLPARADTNKEDGAVDAIRNTKVTLTVQTANNLTPASRIVFTDKPDGPAAPNAKPEQHGLPLTRVADGRYEATFVLTTAGSYAVELLNTYNRPNRDRQARPITVRFDEKPQVSITSPAAELAVRPEEVVPVVFQAADDFGLATIELLTQVDNGEAKASPVTLADKWPRNLTGKHPLAVKDVLAATAAGGTAGKLADAQRITYWLRATDNRDPDPQVTESTRLTLKLDRNAETLAARHDRQSAKDFTEAIRIAIRRLEQVHPEVERLRHTTGERRAIGSDDRRRAEEQKERLEKAATELTKEADQHAVGVYAAMAAQASRISEKRIVVSADQMAKFDLHADQPDLRKEDATTAGREILAGKKELEELLKKVEAQAKLVEAQRKLEELARKQEQVAEQMQQAAAENKKPEPNNQQNVLKDQTQQVVSQTPQLQDKKAQQQAQALNELINKVQEIQQQQAKALEQNQKQAEMAEAADQAKAVAEKQAALNKQVEQFKQADKKPLEQAGAQAPEQKQLQTIVTDLNAAKIQQAVEQQKQAAQRLEENAKQLEQQAKAEKPQLPADQQKQADQMKGEADQANKAAEQAKAQQAQAKEAQKLAAAAAKRAAEAKTPEEQKTAAQQAADAAKQAARMADQAEKAADAVQKKADAGQKSADPAMKQAAKQAGDQAKQAAKAADAAQAAADQAGEKAEQAAKAQEANKKDEAQQAARQAGEKAAEAGQKAQQAADMAAAAARQMADAQKQAADGMKAQARQQIKKDAAAAAEQAKQLAQQQKALAEEAAGPAQAMAQAQQKGAQPPKEAAAQQQQLAERTQRTARQAQQLGQLAEAAGNPNLIERAGMAKDQLDKAQAAQQQAAEAQKQNNHEQAAGAQEAAQNALARAEQALRGQAQQPMAQAQQPAQNGPMQQKPEGQPGEQAAGEQAAGEEAAAGEQPAGEPAGQKGEMAGKGEPGKPGQQAKASQPGEGGAGEPGESKPPQAAMAEPHPGEAGMANAGQGQQAATPQQAMQQAAQSAAEATNAQQQAAQGNQAAARQAAAALAQAAQALAQATGQATTPGQGQGQAQGQQPGQGEQGAESATAGQSGDPKKGIAASANGGSADAPPAVVELGITPSDWAKLGPMQQKELLNAAQQSGPPEYQAMIKNYYVRLSRMQADPGK